MLPVKENMICLFGGISCPEDAMNSLTETYLNDFYILNLSITFIFFEIYLYNLFFIND